MNMVLTPNLIGIHKILKDLCTTYASIGHHQRPPLFAGNTILRVARDKHYHDERRYDTRAK